MTDFIILADLQTKHESNCAEATRTLTTLVHQVLGRTTEEEGEGASSLYLMKAKLRRISSESDIQPSAKHAVHSVIELAVDAADCSDELTGWICESVESWSGLDVMPETCICGFSCLDFPGSEAGWPHANEEALVNALFVVPEFLGSAFVEYVTGPWLKSDWSSDQHRLGAVEL